VEGDLDRPLGQALAPVRRAISPERIPPTVRLTLRTGPARSDRLAASIAGVAARTSSQSSASSSTGILVARAPARRARRQSGDAAGPSRGRPAGLPVVDRVVHLEQVGAADQVLEARTPSAAISPRTSSATRSGS
jgi:hypothetical protein